MVARRKINRRTVFLLNLILSIQNGTYATDDHIAKSIPRDLQTSVFECTGVDELVQEGNIYLEVTGRPAYLQEGHFHVLENALVSLYESAAKQTCSTGYRHLTGAMINRDSIPQTTDVVTFVIDFEVTGRCKGCANNIDFLSNFRRQRRIRATPPKSQPRQLSSKKGSKRSSDSSRYYYQYTNYGSSSSRSSSSRYYYYGDPHVDVVGPSTSTCDCPPPMVEGLEYAFGRIIRDILDLGSIYSGTPRLGDDPDAPTPMVPTPMVPTPSMEPPTPTMPTPMEPTATPPPTVAPGPTDPPVSPQLTASPTRRTTPAPSNTPSAFPMDLSASPSLVPTTFANQPSSTPSISPSIVPTQKSQEPSATPSNRPSVQGGPEPSAIPSAQPSIQGAPEPSSAPSLTPSVKTADTEPSANPSLAPSITTNNVCDAQNSPINYRSANCDVETQTGYQICLEFLNMPCEDAPIFDEAVAFWESVITNDLPNHSIPLNFLQDPGFCGAGYTVPDPMDDLYICASYSPIDGTNNVLGTGTSVNDGTGEPKPILWGILKLDEADIARFQGDRNLYYDVVLHEIGHILGVGNNWRLATTPLVNGNCEYTGAAATAVYRDLSGCTTGFPLAECTNGHWSEDCFDAELMTPSRNAGGVLISEMTIASLDDMGYTTNRNAVQYDFISFDIAQTCRCNVAQIQTVESGLVWQWNKPIKHKDPPITPELREEAKKASPPVAPVLTSNDSTDNITIGTTTTVLFWNEEAETFYEVSIY